MKENTRSVLKHLTNELIRLNKEAEAYYTKAREEEGKVDFFGVVKPFAEEVAEIRDQWMPLAQAFVQKEKPLHLHPSQLQQTEENLEIVAIKSFYKKTSLKRQMETFKSVEYVLHQMIDAIEKKV
ncbi:YppE family protein [Alkalihalobacillus deserti]|uniref:YppE family protein n=1 Tax=Alkalihalobacillus deserti TaxID=2879466 RepID=UPI001D15260F|nr:YppE family protein [Alkalihalobacillus deserti]